MAPSQNQDLVGRTTSQKEELGTVKTIKQQGMNNSKYTKLFRPYDLEAQVKRKSKSFTNNSSSDLYQYPKMTENSMFPTLSEEEYNFKLQKQHAALYIRNVLQFYENGNGWPSVHPNAINNRKLYRSNCR